MSEAYKYKRRAPYEPITKLYTAADRETPPANLHARLTSPRQKYQWIDYFKQRQMKSPVNSFGGKQYEATAAFTALRKAHELQTIGTFVLNAADGSFFGLAEVNPDPYLSRRNRAVVRIPLTPKRFPALLHPLNVVATQQPTTGPLVRAWTFADHTPAGQVALKNTYAALSDPNGIACDFFAKYAELHTHQTEPVRAYTYEPIHNSTQGIHVAITKAGFNHSDTGYYGDSKSFIMFPPISRLYTAPTLDI